MLRSTSMAFVDLFSLSWFLLSFGIVLSDKYEDGKAAVEEDEGSGLDTRTKAYIVCGVLVFVALVLLVALIIVCKRYLSHDREYCGPKSSEKEALYRRENCKMNAVGDLHGYSQPLVDNSMPISTKHQENNEIIATVHMRDNENCLLERKPQSNGVVPATGFHDAYFIKPTRGSGPYYNKSDSNGYNPYSSYSSIPSASEEPSGLDGYDPVSSAPCENEVKRPSNLYEPVEVGIVTSAPPGGDSKLVVENNVMNKVQSARDSDHYIVGNDEYAIIRKDRKSRTSENSSCDSPRCNSAYDNVVVFPDPGQNTDVHNSSTEKILPLPKRGYRNSDLAVKDWENKKDTAV